MNRSKVTSSPPAAARPDLRAQLAALTAPVDDGDLEDEEVEADTRARLAEREPADAVTGRTRRSGARGQEDWARAERYRGKKSSRRDLLRQRGQDDDDDDDDDDVEEEEEILVRGDSSSEDEDQADELEESDVSSVEENGVDDDDNEGVDDDDGGEEVEEEDDVSEEEVGSDLEEEEDDDDDEDDEDEEEEPLSILPTASTSAARQQDEVSKGVALQHQLSVWERLLEVRIQLQKVISGANQFPLSGEHFEAFKSQGDAQHRTSLKKTQAEVFEVLQQLMKLQTDMINGHSEVRASVAGKRRSATEDGDDDEEEEPPQLPSLPKRLKLSEYSSWLNERHQSMVPFRDQTIERWNEKTRLASGHLQSKSFSNFESSTLQQIGHILADPARLISRTQVKRSSYRILGQKVDEQEGDAESKETTTLAEQNAEIFDDDDFYHQLLRELIERKAASGPGAGGAGDGAAHLGQQWMQVQKMRSKLKKKVDTKASKGRKTRYDIHSKLVNFMAPIYAQTWNDDAKNELFSSLFGKNAT